jgi:hypothetical protein
VCFRTTMKYITSCYRLPLIVVTLRASPKPCSVHCIPLLRTTVDGMVGKMSSTTFGRPSYPQREKSRRARYCMPGAGQQHANLGRQDSGCRLVLRSDVREPCRNFASQSYCCLRRIHMLPIVESLQYERDTIPTFYDPRHQEDSFVEHLCPNIDCRDLQAGTLTNTLVE